MTFQPLLREGLLCHPLGDQILVYDPGQDRIHLLDETTGAVVDWLQQGDTAERITTKLEQRTQTNHGEELLALALDELAKADLTQSSAQESVVIPDVTRRRMLASLASIGAAVLIPTIISLTPNTAAAQSSISCGSACTSTAQCPGTTRPECHCCHTGGTTADTCTTDPTGNCH